MDTGLEKVAVKLYLIFNNMGKKDTSKLFIWMCLALPIFPCHSLYSQQLSKEQILHLNFREINKLENELYESGNSSYLQKVLNTHALKAKSLNDTLELIEIYLWRTWLEKPEIAFKFADSSIALAQGTWTKKYQSHVHYNKGALFYENSSPEIALKEFITAYHLANNIGNQEEIIDCLNAIASLKREYGQEKEAVILHREVLVKLRKFGNQIENYKETYLITLDNIARCFLQNRELDSARFYSAKGMEVALLANDMETYEKLSILNAQTNYYDNNFIKARDSLLAYVDNFTGVSRADIFYYLGMIEGKLGNLDKKREYFEAINEIMKANNSPLIDNAKETYQFLLKNAMDSDNSELQQEYLGRLFYYDSLQGVTERNIHSLSLINFDLPVQNLKLSKAIDKVGEKDRILKFWYALSAILLGLFIVFLFIYKKQTQRIRKIMDGKIQPIKMDIHSVSTADIQIDQDIVNKTLDLLGQWEESKGFLDQSTNQISLARELDSNSSYLSKIINTYKGQSFSNYIKDLKITYAINYLKDNPEMIRKKSMIQISEFFGFNSLDVFVRAMKFKIGITPAVFFRRLKKGNL